MLQASAEQSELMLQASISLENPSLLASVILCTGKGHISAGRDFAEDSPYVIGGATPLLDLVNPTREILIGCALTERSAKIGLAKHLHSL